jgi:hypothetical protein
MSEILNNLLAWVTQTTPVLPHVQLMDFYRSFAWAAVVSCLVWRGWFGLGRLPATWRAGLAIACALGMVLPGSLGGAYWLGLAFQAPSLLTTALALWGLSGPWLKSSQSVLSARQVTLLAAVLALVGWVLLFDTLALLPVFIYPWGYGNTPLLALLFIAILLMLVSARGIISWSIIALLLFFTMTRLPSGNVWDALLDPWLWLLAQGWVLRQAYRPLAKRFVTRRAPK